MEIEQLAVERPEALARVAVDPIVGIDAAKAAEIVAAAGFAPTSPTRSPTCSEAVDGLPRGGRDAGRGQPAGPDRGRRDHRARRQGHPRRQRGLPPRGPRGARGQRRRPTRSRPRPRRTTSTTSSSTARSGIIGNGAGLVMSTLDVVALAGKRHGGVKPANFLDIGGGASAEVMADGLDVILGDPQVTAVFVNVFGGITACVAVANGIVAALEMLGRPRDQAARRAPRRQQRRRGPRDPARRRTTRSSPSPTPWTAAPTGRRAGARRCRRTAERRTRRHGDLPDRALHASSSRA